ncbi:hypothetical protein, partial [Pseudomonas sp. A25(2017)]|uniref:hypothetical protein n=1 Tax=Pseudomonas sp. A25(2017) TaxID=1945865 RepID=UPI001C43AB63
MGDSLSVVQIHGANNTAPCGEGACSRWSVGADERSEAAIFSLPIQSGAKDQKIAGFASSYRA